jgi:hypothetical protein
MILADLINRRHLHGHTKAAMLEGGLTTFIKVNSRFCILAKCLLKMITLIQKTIIGFWTNLTLKSSRAVELL